MENGEPKDKNKIIFLSLSFSLDQSSWKTSLCPKRASVDGWMDGWMAHRNLARIIYKSTILGTLTNDEWNDVRVVRME
jgi:hypothetical protein